VLLLLLLLQVVDDVFGSRRDSWRLSSVSSLEQQLLCN
jgi:hypothetical protein